MWIGPLATAAEAVTDIRKARKYIIIIMMMMMIRTPIVQTVSIHHVTRPTIYETIIMPDFLSSPQGTFTELLNPKLNGWTPELNHTKTG